MAPSGRRWRRRSSEDVRIVSLNAGLPRDVEWRGRTVTTAIYKDPVEGRVSLRRLNLDGDRQADLSVHGGAFKAVCCYPIEHYALWTKELKGRDLRCPLFRPTAIHRRSTPNDDYPAATAPLLRHDLLHPLGLLAQRISPRSALAGIVPPVRLAYLTVISVYASSCSSAAVPSRFSKSVSVARSVFDSPRIARSMASSCPANTFVISASPFGVR